MAAQDPGAHAGTEAWDCWGKPCCCWVWWGKPGWVCILCTTKRWKRHMDPVRGREVKDLDNWVKVSSVLTNSTTSE